ncbi:hydroxymethylbilane synthase [Brochothrix campestris]|uniref:Porphobilinogen deaminase n=1 Tax=Brochothrix campestris FSL F6-1037 TaxID=1265861 RepID=W7C8U1_9LIST|nr:hydroxymethylbilane synthase [Brochothrix campestris]EUJ35859.1 porphobilinogen deaminase [Brochothrix campestris FSL F6-1037]
MRTTVTVGTRRSKLAMTQTNHVIGALQASYPTVTFEVKVIVTKGDVRLDQALAKIGGKGLFIKEIESALINGEIDIAVHSMKDMPAELPTGLMIGAIPKREDARDVLISSTGASLEQLPSKAVIGTSSLRRQAQLLAVRPDLQIKLLRGNVDTRLQKCRDGEYDAIILAAAGLKRLGLYNETEMWPLPTNLCLPAVGQGALAIECRREDDFVREMLASVHEVDTAKTVLAERAFLNEMDGSCHMPIGGYATLVHDTIKLETLLAATDGQTVIRGKSSGSDSQVVGQQAKKQLFEQGAAAMIAALNITD